MRSWEYSLEADVRMWKCGDVKMWKCGNAGSRHFERSQPEADEVRNHVPFMGSCIDNACY